MLILSPFLLIKQESILRLDVANLIVQSKKIVLQIFQLEKLFLERTNHGILMSRLGLLQVRVVSSVSIHDSMSLSYRK